MTVDPVLSVVALGDPPWPTLDPFLFCVHHLDAYPEGNGRFGPDPALLRGRAIGNDFAGVDGWRMYHGDTVPGFPQHPHRGFETVTIVRSGYVDHADSLGAAARYGDGDVQWLTAGAGIVHAEMFPLLADDAPNPLELFQLWLNLPASDKFAAPHFSIAWRETIPVVRELAGPGADAAAVTVTVVAGAYRDATPPAPPPESWAARPDADVAIWIAELDAGARWTLPPAQAAAAARVVYVFEGSGLTVDGSDVGALPARAGLQVRPDVAVTLRAGATSCAVLVLQGVPIGEPVASYGPFVMNTRAEIEAAFAEFRRTGFGGWPWSDDGPVHADAPGRFARHPDGRTDVAPS